jgi:hypothetical protein
MIAFTSIARRAAARARASLPIIFYERFDQRLANLIELGDALLRAVARDDFLERDGGQGV